MKPTVWSLGFLLLTFGNILSGTSPSFLKGLTEDAIPGKQEETDAPIKTVTCDWTIVNEIDRARLVEDNAVKLALYDAVVSGRGLVKAKKNCYTIEGDPIPVYATVKRGKIKITQDYSKDRWLKFQGVLKLFGNNSYATRKIEIGYLEKGNFIPLNRAEPTDKRLFLRLKGKNYF